MKTELLTKSIFVSAVAFAFLFSGCNSTPTAVQEDNETSITGEMVGKAPPPGLETGNGYVLFTQSTTIKKKNQKATLSQYCPKTSVAYLTDDNGKRWKVTYSLDNLKLQAAQNNSAPVVVVSSSLKKGGTCKVTLKAIQDNAFVPPRAYAVAWNGKAKSWVKD